MVPQGQCVAGWGVWCTCMRGPRPAARSLTPTGPQAYVGFLGMLVAFSPLSLQTLRAPVPLPPDRGGQRAGRVRTQHRDGGEAAGGDGGWEGRRAG